MKVFKIKSYAKLNLALNVTGKNSKLHRIESIISFINFCDLIYLKLINDKDHKIYSIESVFLLFYMYNKYLDIIAYHICKKFLYIYNKHDRRLPYFEIDLR